MTEENKKQGYIKKETLYFSIIIVFVLGYIAGVGTTVYKFSDSPSQPAPTGSTQVNPGMASSILQLEEDLKKSPDNVNLLVQLGNLYFDTDNYKKAIKSYEKSLTFRQDPNVLTDLGVMYRRTGNPEKAITNFQKAYAINPDHEMSRLNEGIVRYHDLNDAEGAIEALKGLLERNPNAVTATGAPIADFINEISGK